MRRKLVVSVEYDEAQRELFKCAFEECNVDFDLRIFPICDDLFDFLSESSGSNGIVSSVALAILNLNNRGMRDESLLQRLRSNQDTAYLPVAVFCDVVYQEEVVCAYQRGATAYLVKPVNFEEYIAALRDTLRFWGRNHAMKLH